MGVRWNRFSAIPETLEAQVKVFLLNELSICGRLIEFWAADPKSKGLRYGLRSFRFGRVGCKSMRVNCSLRKAGFALAVGISSQQWTTMDCYGKYFSREAGSVLMISLYVTTTASRINTTNPTWVIFSRRFRLRSRRMR